jgi:hypothetical protein
MRVIRWAGCALNNPANVCSPLLKVFHDTLQEHSTGAPAFCPRQRACTFLRTPKAGRFAVRTKGAFGLVAAYQAWRSTLDGTRLVAGVPSAMSRVLIEQNMFVESTIGIECVLNDRLNPQYVDPH